MLKDYETIVMSGNEPLWYVPKDDQTVIAYTHSPPRWQYDLFHDLDGGFPALAYNYMTRVLYQHNAARPDLYVANSDLVARRINQYWNIPKEQIQVVYPPVNTHKYSPTDAPTRDYYVTVSRLDGPKKIDDIIHAFDQSGHELRIAGRGPERERLERLAGENIHFEGFVSEERKQELLSEAKAFVFAAQNEDFGMAPVEAMAAGTPVIGVDDGLLSTKSLTEKTASHSNEGIEDLRRVFEPLIETG